MAWLCLFTQERSPGSLCCHWGSRVDSSVRPFHRKLPSSAGLCLPVEVHLDPKPRVRDPTCGNQKLNNFCVFVRVKFLVEVSPCVLTLIESLIISAVGCILMRQELHHLQVQGVQLLGVQNSSTGVDSSPGSPELAQQECWTVTMRDWRLLRALCAVLLGESPSREVKTIPIPFHQQPSQCQHQLKRKRLGNTPSVGKEGFLMLISPSVAGCLPRADRPGCCFSSCQVRVLFCSVPAAVHPAGGSFCGRGVILHSLPGQQALLPSASFICFCNNTALPRSFCGYFFRSFFLLPC